MEVTMIGSECGVYHTGSTMADGDGGRRGGFVPWALVVKENMDDVSL